MTPELEYLKNVFQVRRNFWESILKSGKHKNKEKIEARVLAYNQIIHEIAAMEIGDL